MVPMKFNRKLSNSFAVVSDTGSTAFALSQRSNKYCSLWIRIVHDCSPNVIFEYSILPDFLIGNLILSFSLSAVNIAHI